MTPQEKKINDIAEALIERFYSFNPSYLLATKCAIECQREVVQQLSHTILWVDESTTNYIKCKHFYTEAQQVLENLEKRLL